MFDKSHCEGGMELKAIINQNKKWIDGVWEKVNSKMICVAQRSKNKLPYSAQNGVHDDYVKKDVTWWTNGFWGGMLWLMYKETGNELYKDVASHAGVLLDEALAKYKSLHHDVGFMWHLTSGAKYKITSDNKAFTTNMFAAATLASRYNVDAGYIRAWNSQVSAGCSIIDCLMNLSLLYWASEETGDFNFKNIAMHHADMAINDHIRSDGSVNHIVDHNIQTGAVKEIRHGQGYSETSCWSRGQAWAVYGMVISYIHTKKQEYLDAAVKTANYFIANCAYTDYLPLIDFRQPTEPVYYDSTAGACCACGLLELAKYVSEAESKMYTASAIKILKALDERCCNYSKDVDYLVGMGSERYPKNDEELKTVHMPIIYGDFFYIEALLKLRENNFFIW